MKKQFLLITAAMALVLFSCKKENTPNPSNPGGSANTDLVKTVTHSAGITTNSYDANGRITLESESSGSKTEYEYQGNLVIQKFYTTAGANTTTFNFEVGPDGVTVKETKKNDPVFNRIFTYNNDKQLVKMVDVPGNTSVDYFYSNGNCDSTRYMVNGSWSNTVVRTFFTDKPNGLSNDNFGEAVFGKSSKNLVKSEYYHYSGSSQVDGYDMVYEFDAKGRVSKKTATGSGPGVNGNIYVTYFTY